MECTIIACNTLRDETEFVMKELSCEWPILWVDSGLHDFPDKLRKEIQERIDSVDGSGDILLMFGVCGNSVLGLTSARHRLIMPLVDDCISLFLGGNALRKAVEEAGVSYYLTRGYLRNEKNIWTEYLYTLNKYGPERTKMIYEMMLHNYQRLILIDTGAYEVEEIREESQHIADTFGLVFDIVRGKLDLIYRALRCQWAEGFMVVEPGHVVDYVDLGILKC